MSKENPNVNGGGGQSIKISTGSREYLSKHAELFSRAFLDDPVFRFQLESLPEKRRIEYMPTYIHSLVKAAALSGGIFQEANDWSCAALWMPPGHWPPTISKSVQAGILGVLWNIGISGTKRILIDFQQQSDACKRKYLRDENGKRLKRYHYLFIIATDLPARGKGLASEIIQQWQRKATEDQLPIWLEASTPRARDVYLRQGFKVVQELRMGKGTHTENGCRATEGEAAPGVPFWVMVWWPKMTKDEKA